MRLFSPSTQQAGIDRVQLRQQALFVTWIPLMANHDPFDLAFTA